MTTMDDTTQQQGRRIVSWEEPPPAAHGNRVYDDIAEQLQSHPGTWARLDDRFSENAASQFASNVRTGKFPAFSPRGAFDARHNDTMVWVRFVGLDLRR